MNNEIKEIRLDHFNSIEELRQNVNSWIKEEDMYWNRYFSLEDLKILLDYMIDLRQENEKLNNRINKCAEEILKEINKNNHLSVGIALTIRQKLIDYRELKENK